MSDLFAAMERTWPAASTRRVGGWLVREGQGAGRRVSAATAEDETAIDTIPAMEAAQAALGQPALVSLRPGQEAIEQALADRGYRVEESVTLYAAPVGPLAAEAPEWLTTFPIWPPLAIMAEIWDEGHIGPARRAVMARAEGAKTAILGRAGDRAAGAVYVAVDGATAMLHSLFVTPAQRRQGLGVNLMRAASRWAEAQGAVALTLAVEDHNAPARALYERLGMRPVLQYRYRQK